MKRRTFLIGTAGGAGVLVFGACSEEEPGEDLAADPTATTGDDAGGLEPLPRPTLRLPGGDSGFPSPFAYRRGGGYIQ